MAEAFQQTHMDNEHQHVAGVKNPRQGALVSKNVRIHDRRTSVRLEPCMWQALREIAEIERCSIHDLCGAVYDSKEEGASFTAALRVYLMEYYRTAARTSRQVTSVQQHLKTAVRPGPVAADMPHKITA